MQVLELFALCKGGNFKETKSATMNIFLFKSFVKAELS